MTLLSSHDRSLRVAELLKRELSYLLSTKVKDPRVEQVMITEVQSASRLSQVKVYVYAAESIDREQLMTGLACTVGFLRRQLGRRLKMRHIPKLQFIFDETLERSERIRQLIRSCATASERRSKQ